MLLIGRKKMDSINDFCHFYVYSLFFLKNIYAILKTIENISYSKIIMNKFTKFYMKEIILIIKNS